jgi:hypothetical protein
VTGAYQPDSSHYIAALFVEGVRVNFTISVR